MTVSSQKLKNQMRRSRLLTRALRKSFELSFVQGPKDGLPKREIAAFATVRNEAHRLPYWLDHHRKLGVARFYIVENGSTDDTLALLKAQPDVALWTTKASYRASRFGMDWLTYLQIRFGANRWCLTLDADELFIYPHHDARTLSDLTAELESQNADSFGALMLDLYPETPLGAGKASDNPLQDLPYFDAEGYWWVCQPKYSNISIRGGVRERVFFADQPELGPHLHKIPLIYRRRGSVYVSSTHIALPTQLNTAFDARLNRPTGVLLHTKFLPEIVAASAEEAQRKEHFTHPSSYAAYYNSIATAPLLWHRGSERYKNWQQLERLGLMTRGSWE